MSFKNGAVQDRYLWSARQDELLCKNNEWTLGDHLNTVRDVVKSDGSVVKHLEYTDKQGLGVYASKNCVLASSTLGRFTTTCLYDCICNKGKDIAHPLQGQVTGRCATDDLNILPDEFPCSYSTSVSRPWSCDSTLVLYDQNVTDIPSYASNCSQSACMADAARAESTYKRTVCRLSPPGPLKTACNLAATGMRASLENLCSMCRNP